MTKSLYIIALILPMLACGANVSAPVPSAVPTPPVVDGVKMIVTGLYDGEPLNIRDAANGRETGKYLYNGNPVTVYEVLVVGDTEWCRHELGWSACRFLEAK